MDLDDEDDCNAENRGNIPGYRYAVVKARAVLDAVNDVQRQRELISRSDLTIGRNLDVARRALSPHTNRALRGTQFDP